MPRQPDHISGQPLSVPPMLQLSNRGHGELMGSRTGERPKTSPPTHMSGSELLADPKRARDISEADSSAKGRATLASLPPAPKPAGIARLLSEFLGGPLQPLRFFWLFARWLWLAIGLIVVGAAALDYLGELFTGNLPSVTDAFFSSPVLVVPSRYPLRFLAVMTLCLVLTILAWGAAHEHRRRLNAEAERVRQAIRAGMSVEQLDEEMVATLLRGDIQGTFQLATQVHEQNRCVDVLWLYQALLEKEPKHFGANYNLGLACAELERFDTAEGYCRAAVLLNSDSAEAQGLTAYVLYRLGFLEEAQRRARLAVRMGFSSQMLEALILPGLGVSNSLPAVRSSEDGEREGH